MDRLTQKDILELKAGAMKSFGLKDNAACNAAKTCVQYVKRMHKEAMTSRRISDYKVNVNWDQSIVTIAAIEVSCTKD